MNNRTPGEQREPELYVNRKHRFAHGGKSKVIDNDHKIFENMQRFIKNPKSYFLRLVKNISKLNLKNFSKLNIRSPGVIMQIRVILLIEFIYILRLFI